MISEYSIQTGFFNNRAEFWSQTPDVMPGGRGSIETTHPTAHPRVYFWYLN